MKTVWQRPIERQIEIQREIPKIQPDFLIFECLYGPHKAEVLHRGTAYCRSHYDRKNLMDELIN